MRTKVLILLYDLTELAKQKILFCNVQNDEIIKKIKILYLRICNGNGTLDCNQNLIISLVLQRFIKD
jgi:hypothetical protein